MPRGARRYVSLSYALMSGAFSIAAVSARQTVFQMRLQDVKIIGAGFDNPRCQLNDNHLKRNGILWHTGSVALRYSFRWRISLDFASVLREIVLYLARTSEFDVNK